LHQRLGEALHRELRGAIGRVRDAGAERRPEPVHARGVRDVALVARDQQRHERPAAVVDAAPADAERAVPVVTRAGDERAAAAVAEAACRTFGDGGDVDVAVFLGRPEATLLVSEVDGAVTGWGARAKTSKDWWHLSFCVLVDVFDDNPASQAVSRALGYRPNG